MSKWKEGAGGQLGQVSWWTVGAGELVERWGRWAGKLANRSFTLFKRAKCFFSLFKRLVKGKAQSGKNECLAQLSLIPGIVLNLGNFKMNWSIEFWSAMPVTVSVTLWSNFFFCRNASTSWVRNSTWATRTSWRPRSWPCQLSTNIRTRWLPSGLLLSIRDKI